MLREVTPPPGSLLFGPCGVLDERRGKHGVVGFPRFLDFDSGDSFSTIQVGSFLGSVCGELHGMLSPVA